MSQSVFRCPNCGYIPREPPISGSWYCPKCGKRMEISQPHPHTVKKSYKKPLYTQTSRDHMISQIYDKLKHEKKTDSGYKEPYLNPKIPPIQLKKRKNIRFFFKKNSKE
jgi:uncharacterized Zn finger protein (UPF0148 family)